MDDTSDVEARLAALEARVRELEDDRAIRDVMARYGFTADNCQDSEFVELFTNDAEVSVTATGDTDRNGKGVITWSGKEGVRTFISDPNNHHRPGSYGKWMHAQGNNLVTHIDGDEAEATSYSIVLVADDGQVGVKLVSAGNNHWVFKQVDGKWLIQERRRRQIGDDYYTSNLEVISS
jgi:hypothetical protein